MIVYYKLEFFVCYSIPKYEICKIIANVETFHDFVVLSYIIALTQRHNEPKSIMSTLYVYLFNILLNKLILIKNILTIRV